MKALHLIGAAGTLLAGSSVYAGGTLWLGCEYQTEGTIYRYNIGTGTIDVSIDNNFGPDHINDCATDGTHVYISSPGSGSVGVCDIETGAIISTVAYSSALGGHKEDGAYRASSGTLWRMTYTGSLLHEYQADGTVVASYTLDTGSLVGAAWVGDQLYATSYSNGSIGTIDINGANAEYTAIPWATGAGPASSQGAALAYDECDDVLYMINGGSVLYTVTFDGGEAYATELVDLDDVGFPSGGLVDGMGWVAPPCTADLTADGTVNVLDLLEMLGAWGPSKAACAADLNSDGVVNVLDLLVMLGAWGPC